MYDMYISLNALPAEDTFDDIWPVKDQPSSYLTQLLNWRPAAILPCRDDLDHDPEHDLELSDGEDWHYGGKSSKDFFYWTKVYLMLHI